MAQYKSFYSAKGCTRCELIINAAMRPTLGLGFDCKSTAEIMFIGEAPGHTENRTKIPFSGKSGTLLRKYIKDSNIDDVSYITNVIKCRPPGNRNPSNFEVKQCGIHLSQEIIKFKPKIIVTCGKFAMDFFKPFDSRLINTIQRDTSGCIFIYTYHPSYIIREDRYYIYDKTFTIIRDVYKAINPNFILY